MIILAFCLQNQRLLHQPLLSLLIHLYGYIQLPTEQKAQISLYFVGLTNDYYTGGGGYILMGKKKEKGDSEHDGIH